MSEVSGYSKLTGARLWMELRVPDKEVKMQCEKEAEVTCLELRVGLCISIMCTLNETQLKPLSRKHADNGNVHTHINSIAICLLESCLHVP